MLISLSIRENLRVSLIALLPLLAMLSAAHDVKNAISHLAVTFFPQFGNGEKKEICE